MQENAVHALLYIADSLDEAALPPAVRVQDADIEHWVADAFGIADARALFARAHLRPVTRPRREFLVHFATATTEGQNALLKLFEDPPADTVFHVVVRRADLLIPTLRSRLMLVDVAHRAAPAEAFSAFLQMDHGERLECIKERAAKKDTAWFEDIARGAEHYAETKAREGARDLLASVVFVRQYLGARGASSKMLLEEFALALPILK